MRKVKISFGDEQGRTITIRYSPKAVDDLRFEEFILTLSNLLFRHIHEQQRKAHAKSKN